MAKRRTDLGTLLPQDFIIKGLNQRRDLLEEQREEIETQLELIERELKRFGVHGNNGSSHLAKGRRGGRKGRRTRRSREEIQAAAKKVVDFISAGGKEGRSGREIKAKFGALLPSVKGWL